MTVAPILTRTTTAPPVAGVPVEPLPAAVRLALTRVTPDPYALLEAALAWHQLRPSGTGRGGAQGRPVRHPGTQRYLLLARDCPPDVADRLVRLLGRLAWTVTVPGDGTGDPATAGHAAGGPHSVLVPERSYHLVLRGLTTAWRHARRGHPAGTPTGRPDPGGAAALWRMGLLLAGVRGTGDRARLRLSLRATPEAAAGLLATAAWTLGAAATIEDARGGPAVLVGRAEDVRRLIVAAS